MFKFKEKNGTFAICVEYFGETRELHSEHISAMVFSCIKNKHVEIFKLTRSPKMVVSVRVYFIQKQHHATGNSDLTADQEVLYVFQESTVEAFICELAAYVQNRTRRVLFYGFVRASSMFYYSLFIIKDSNY